MSRYIEMFPSTVESLKELEEGVLQFTLKQFKPLLEIGHPLYIKVSVEVFALDKLLVDMGRVQRLLERAEKRRKEREKMGLENTEGMDLTVSDAEIKAIREKVKHLDQATVDALCAKAAAVATEADKKKAIMDNLLFAVKLGLVVLPVVA